MINLKKQLLSLGITSSLLISTISPAFAASPDGQGPWADKVKKFNQGTQKNGNPVLAIRGNPEEALGVAEGDNADGHFVSLGFGGKLVLKFKNGIKDGVFIVESTRLPYPSETAKIEISSNGKKWKEAGSISRTGSVKQPEEIKCAHFVRIIDTSDPSLFDSYADGFDVDGVKAEGENCKKEDHEDEDKDDKDDDEYRDQNHKKHDGEGRKD